MSEEIQFEGRTVAVIAPEDLEEMEEELTTLRARVSELESEKDLMCEDIVRMAATFVGTGKSLYMTGGAMPPDELRIQALEARVPHTSEGKQGEADGTDRKGT